MGRFLEIVQKIVLERLNFLTEYKHQTQVQIVINQSGTPEDIQKAEEFLLGLLKEWGEVIIGGDLLTVERIDQNKSLRSSNMSEFGKGSFVGPSRIAIFHFKQNILLKLYAALMPNLHDSNNPGSLNSFRALSDKAKFISNQEGKIKDDFELHLQFLLAISEVYLEEKIHSFAKKKFGAKSLEEFASILKNSEEKVATDIIDELLKDSSQTVFYQQNFTLGKYLSATGDDDLLKTGEMFVSVWFLFKSLEFITKSGDPDGIEYFKKNAILLVLSLHSTSSKYVHKGFHELIKMKSMSERQKLRFNSGSFVKYHGKQSKGACLKPGDLNNRSEDMVCEWLVGDVKSSLKSLGGNYTEETIEKKSRAMSLGKTLVSQDDKSLLIEGSGPGTSWERFEAEEIDRFRKYVHKLDPFRFILLP